MAQVELNKQAHLSEHLTTSSVATLGHSSELDGSRLSPHFTLGELCKTSAKTQDGNIPSHVHIENLKRLCGWLEMLRKRYNERYVVNRRDVSTTLDMTKGVLSSRLSALEHHPFCHLERSREISPRAALGRDDNEDREEPIIINSGYRSPEVNKAVGGVATSNHLTGCAADIRVSGIEQLIRYATILLDISDESQEDFDELLIERSPKGSYWLHFAVRPSGNRRKVRLIQT
jgi:hypothetical protein